MKPSERLITTERSAAGFSPAPPTHEIGSLQDPPLMSSPAPACSSSGPLAPERDASSPPPSLSSSCTAAVCRRSWSDVDVQLGDGRVPAFSLLVFVVTVSCFQTVAVYLCSFCVRSWGFCTCVQCLLRLCRNVVFVRSIYVHGVSFF